MSIFTVVIIIWAVYQLITSVIKKNGTPQAPGKLSDSFKLPNGRSIGDIIQGASSGTWRDQLKQALENGSYQVGPSNPTKPLYFEETKGDYVETEGTQGIEGTQGTEGTSDYVGILGLEAYKGTEEKPGEQMDNDPLCKSGIRLILTERELVQGVMWAEILSKPRAVRPFRGPRTF